MSKDIRSFFSVGGSKAKKPDPPRDSSSSSSKRKAVIVDSDEESTEHRKPSSSSSSSSKDKSGHSKKRRVIDSDDEKSPVKKKVAPEPAAPKLKECKAEDFFGSAPVKRIETPRPSKKAVKEEVAVHSDEEFEKSLSEMVVPETPPPPPAASKKKSEKVKSPAKNGGSGKEKNGHEESKKKTPTPEKKSNGREEVKSTPPPAKKEKPASIKRESSAEQGTPKSTKKDLNESVLTDEERYERKRMAAALYKKFQSRQGPANPGSKEIPKGTPTCLAGLQFVVTGVMESMERDECAQVIKDFGGKVVTSVSKKLTHMVVGEDAGPSKLAKADELGIPQISEDQLFDLIRERSGLPVKAESKPKVKEEKPKIKEEKSPSKEKKRTKTAEQEVKKRTPEKHKLSESVAKLPKIPKIEKRSPEQSKPIKIEKKSPKKEPEMPPINREETAYQKDIQSTDNMAWVDKYKPTSIKQIIGQAGPASNVQKLLNWLSKWHSNHDGKKVLQRPSPWAKNDDGAYFKAALLSGPPGVGKTTTATLVCKELGFDAVEFNASDTRSKKLLKEQVSELLTNKSLFGYFTGNGKGDKVTHKHVLVMDEVDGMAGNEDRGGIQELIGLIKDSHVPIICMCNDRNHQKMRSLVNYCFDLRFNKPRVEQIKVRRHDVGLLQGGLKLAPGALEEIIAGTGGDVRQTLNHLALHSTGKTLGGTSLSAAQAKQEAQTARKDVKMGPWDVIRKVFSAEDHRTMSIHDKSDLFFHDYSLAPLFVQENYLKVTPKVPKAQHLDQIALAADSLSRGDLIDRRIRSSMAWSLLPMQAMFSSVLPGEYMEGNFTGQINFPGWLGKNSKASKRKRLAQEIHDHTRMSTSGSRLSVRLDYAPYLLGSIVRPLQQKGSEGVQESLDVIKEYRLLREDLESLVELTSWPKKKSPMDAVDGKVKAALTRAYNKEVAPYTYSVVNAVKKKKSEAADDAAAEAYGEDAEEAGGAPDSEEEKEDDDLENNAFIKVKKKPAGKGAAATAGSSKAAGSKGGSKAAKGGAGGSSSARGKKK
ncbi:replication factor C large subunit [Culex quinquefasciatus]|uniref:Replication factor C subunit 1 n=1 Tax=Culex quinquefasciatus TaxID=7176 RepID=B0XEK3_CULQU|nr:replication factor C large subunit [Culex quinquefasciatus]|eukprot:XP_001868075.1 replication factor C large subunit [Culex quinquefasciatus]